LLELQSSHQRLSTTHMCMMHPQPSFSPELQTYLVHLLSFFWGCEEEEISALFRKHFSVLSLLFHLPKLVYSPSQIFHLFLLMRSLLNFLHMAYAATSLKKN
jgi:hypothetical protein